MQKLTKDFYKWLDKCPTLWIKEKLNKKGITYFFKNIKEFKGGLK